jgi:AcrR family transcriptional regulator
MMSDRTTLKRTLIRNKIIDVALKEFNSQGFERTTTNQIADTLGMTGPSLYYYFRTKDELLLACVESLMSTLVSHLQSAVQEPGNALDQVRRLVEIQVQHELSIASVGTVVNAYLYGPQHATAMLKNAEQCRLKELQNSLVNLYATTLTKAMQAGLIAEQDVKIVTFNVLAVIQYTAVWFKPEGRLDLRAIALHQAAAVLALIGAKTS